MFPSGYFPPGVPLRLSPSGRSPQVCHFEIRTAGFCLCSSWPFHRAISFRSRHARPGDASLDYILSLRIGKKSATPCNRAESNAAVRAKCMRAHGVVATHQTRQDKKKSAQHSPTAPSHAPAPSDHPDDVRSVEDLTSVLRWSCARSRASARLSLIMLASTRKTKSRRDVRGGESASRRVSARYL